MSVLSSEIRGLSVADKFDLLDALWQYIDEHSSALSEEQSVELDRRMAEYEQDRSAVIPWKQVKAGLPK